MGLKVALNNALSRLTVGSAELEMSHEDRKSIMDEIGPAEHFDLGALRQRLRDYLVTHYLGLHITIVSVALAIAGLSAAGLVTEHGIAAVDLALLCLLWLGSLLATAVAYAGTMVGAFALPSAVPSIYDLLLPLLMGVMEFVLFAILIPVPTFTEMSRIINAWLILMAPSG